MIRIFLILVFGFFVLSSNLSAAEKRERKKTEQWAQDPRLLPQYCKDRANGSQSAEWAKWRGTFGEAQIHVHHYCAGIYAEQKARITVDQQERKRWLRSVKNQMRYVSNHCSESCVLYPELHSRWGWALGEDGQTADAINHFQMAIKVKPDYATAYAKLSDLYLDMKQPDDARRVLDAGLKAKPGSRMLQRRLRELETQ